MNGSAIFGDAFQTVNLLFQTVSALNLLLLCIYEKSAPGPSEEKDSPSPGLF